MLRSPSWIIIAPSLIDCQSAATTAKTFHWGLLIIINAIRALTSHNRRSKLHHNHILYPHDDVPTELESLCSSTFTHGQSTFLLLKHFGRNSLGGLLADWHGRGGWQSTDSLFTRLDKPCIIISTHSFCYSCYYTKHTTATVANCFFVFLLVLAKILSLKLTEVKRPSSSAAAADWSNRNDSAFLSTCQLANEHQLLSLQLWLRVLHYKHAD